ncbi:hypothetical protein CRE_17930 [Caenorhabditis remanei]|uniref:Uncharacterized protein n=1 Tax=Caenorhabditis remanei TaxID=31234 RepID=E3MDM1_CAERE|nr:hypothetical protein CRE_17930 [Caenorhabditis remanei]
MLTYPCQSVVFLFLDFEKRCHVAKRCRQVRNRHRILPLYIRNLEISQFENYFHLKINNYNTWIFPDTDRPFSEHWTCINHEKEAIGNEKTQKINCHVEKIVEKVLIYYLGRTDTIVKNLTVKEIFKISRENRPIGAIIDYYVHDYFNTKLYPNFAKIVADLKAKRTKIGRINAITIPMESDAELNVFIVPEDEERIKNTWILRMAVMEKRRNAD